MNAADYLTGKHNKALNVICVEEAGWTHLRKIGGIACGLRPGWIHGENSEPLPNYTTDQNAARSLLAILSDQWEWMDFHVELGKILGCSHTGPFDQYKARMLATALQISVAFAVARGRV